MILLLSDETWAKLVIVLDQSDEGREIVRELTERPKLPSDRELVRQARVGGPAPAAIARAAARRERAIEASATTRDELASLVRDIHEAGVGVTAIARWTGLRPTRIYEILGQIKEVA
jgi:vacuolar-type H+-ATPase catalytic subunit A/Vma1